MKRIHILIGSLLSVLLFGCARNEEIIVDATTQNLLVQGEQALRSHQFAAALALADSAERRLPDLADTQFLKGRIYSDMLRFADAEAAYEKTLELDRDYKGVYNNLGNNAFREGEYRRAVQLFHEEIERHPAPYPWHGLGRAYIELGVPDSGRIAFEQALAVDSLFTPALLSLSLLHEDGGELDKALAYAEQGLRIQPQDLEFRYEVGSLLSKAGRFEESLPHLKRVVDEQPWHHASWYALGQAVARLGREADAQPILERAEQLRARDARILERERIVRAQPSNPVAHAALGSELRLAGRYNDAVHAYMVAYTLNPKDIEVRNNIAALHLVRRDTLQSIQWYQRILDENPRFLEGWLNLGVVYAISGREQEARQAWESALRLKPDSPEAKRYLAKLAGR